MPTENLITPIETLVGPPSAEPCVQIVDRIGDIGRAEWDSVFPDIPESYAFYQVLEASHFEDFTFSYVLIRQKERLIGVAPCFFMNYSLDTTVQGVLKTFSNAVKKIFPAFMSLRVMVCGLPMGQGRVGIADGNGEVMRLILRGVEEAAAKKNASIIAFKDFGTDDAPKLDFLRREGFYKFESLPSTVMKIGFKDFDGYLKTLSRASRDGLKRKLKKVSSCGIEMEIREDPGHYLDEVYALYLQTVRRHDQLSFETVPKAFFTHAAEQMPGKTKFFLWKMEGRVVAFAFCLVSGTYFIDYYLGFDYSLAHDYHLFFVRFRDLFDWCLSNGMETYEMGSTSYEPKRRLGFGFLRLFGYARCRTPWLNPFFKALCALLRPENFDPVFKIMRERTV
jgi:predicted N-acyltransferase